MKKLIVANWKENKTRGEVLEWLKVFLKEFAGGQDFSRTILCASYPLLYPLRRELEQRRISLKLGAQDVSRFEQGAYTGEVSLRQLVDLVDYVLLGHSERQKYFGETLEDVAAKIRLCQKYGLKTLIFLRSVADLKEIKKNISSFKGAFLVYEPPSAISQKGVYRAQDSTAVAEAASAFKREAGGTGRVLYGGSVNAESIGSFLACPEIDGVVVGQASLEPVVFARIVKSA